MQGATLEELRDLSRRSRRAQAIGFLTLVGALGFTAASLVAPSWARLPLFAALGLGFVAYAYTVGQERGAFRRVFKRLNDERRATRTVPVQAAIPGPTLVPRDV